jgi:O-antigen/teichoic acid export membrane protein
VVDGRVQAVAVDDDELVEGALSESELSSLGSKAGKGLRWALVGNLVLKVGSFALSLAMVRLLAPHDFGLYAVALAANAFLIHVNDAGLIAATVQWRGRVEEMLTTARTMAISFSLAWYGLFWVGAPILAGAAGSPDATPLVRLMTLAIVIDGVTAVSVGMIQRRFQQDKLMKAIAAGFVANAIVCLSLAIAGAGAYSFVIGALAQAVVVAVLVLWMAHLPFRLGFDKVVARRLLVFGIPLAIGLGLESIVLFSDSVIVGHVLGTDELGFYLLAYNISSWVPGLVGAAVRYVSIPAFSRLAEGETDVFSVGVQRALPMLVAFVAPVAAVMVTLSPALIGFLYGADWVESAKALEFLAFVTVARMVTALVFDIQTGLGNTKVTIWLNLTWGAALLPALWIGANTGGIRGAAMAHAAVAFLVAIPLAGVLLHRAGVHMGPVLRRIVRPVLAAVVAGLVMAAVSHPITSYFLQLVVAGSLGMATYLAIVVPAEGRAAVRRLLAARVGAGRGVAL